jgi:8-oxo-dGTP diphosphatase
MERDKPTEGAAAVIFDDAGRVLLVRENYGKRRWSLPGGAIEPGETPEQAVVRETMEETLVTARIDHLIGRYTLADGFVCFVFRCEIERGAPLVPATGEIADIRWAPPDDLPTRRSNALHYAVPDALAGERNVDRIDLPLIS